MKGAALLSPCPCQSSLLLCGPPAPGLLCASVRCDPLVRPRCGRQMKVIAVIDQADVISRIFSRLALMSGEDPSWSSGGNAAAATAPKELVYVAVDDDRRFPDAA